MNQAAKDIIRELEHIGATGVSQYQIFEDWLDMVHATLERLPAHLKNAVEKRPLADTPEVQAMFERFQSRYAKPYCWEHFSKAFAILLNSADEYNDTIGEVYMEWGIPNKHMGQFFTPYPIAAMMAKLTMNEDEIYTRLQAAYEKSPTGIMHVALTGDKAAERIPAFVRKVGSDLLPFCVEHFDPITVCDCCCGSGVMLLAAAEVTPRWALDWGLVQFYGQDIDRTCVRMAQVNMMLYGLNGFNLKCALELSQAELKFIPEPWQAKFIEAQEAESLGQFERVDEIATELRAWQQPALL
jgi:type I restriction-modification system DNA methylase subunit